MDFTDLRPALSAAVMKAIATVGIENFKRTSLFLSNERASAALYGNGPGSPPQPVRLAGASRDTG